MDGTFSRSDFRYDPTTDVYHCPAGKTLTTTGTLVNDGTTLIYLARKRDCDGCKLRAQCCPKVPFRKFHAIITKPLGICAFPREDRGFEPSRLERKKIEMRFAHLKRILGLVGFDCGVHAVPRTSLFSPPSPRTYGGS